MNDISGLGAYGIFPFGDSNELRKFKQITTQAGKIAYVESLGKNAKAPTVHEGINEARGALKWIKESLKEEEQ
ncbi:MAG: hypothetical protein ABIH69_07840 [bacterium]